MSAKYPMPLDWSLQYVDPTRAVVAGEQLSVWDATGRDCDLRTLVFLRNLEDKATLPYFRAMPQKIQLDFLVDWMGASHEIGETGVPPERILEELLALPDEWDDNNAEWYDLAPPVDYSNGKPSPPNTKPPPFTASQRWREGAKETGEALVRIGANPSHHLVALYMLAHAHKDTGEMFPSYSTLAALTGLSQRSTVADAVRWLVAHKVLKRTREARRDGTPARYVFNPVERWKP